MLTKTRKWLVVLVFAFIAMFLVACTPKTEPEPVAPTSLEVFADTYIGETGVLLDGAAMELSVEVVPATAVKTVTWSSEDEDIATVDEFGKVTGHKGGIATIIATSTMTPTIKDEIEIKVYEDTDEARVLFNAMQYIKTNTPKYVAETFTFPVYENELVSADYYDVEENKLASDRYTYDYVADTIETVKCVLSYEETTIEFQLTLNIVDDVAINEFTAIESAKVQVAKYLNEEAKITNSIILPTSLVQAYELNFAGGEFEKDVQITWTSSMSTVLAVDEAYDYDSTPITNAVYTRPADDTLVTLEAYYVCGGVTGVTRHNMMVKGYTQEEKMNYIVANVLPADYTMIEGSNLTLPIMDPKFGATITWESDNASVLSNRGKMDPYLETETVVKLTATIAYVGNSDDKNFEETHEINITVKPAINDAQKVALDLSNKFEDETFPHYFPWGITGREAGNTVPLPETVGGEGVYKDIAVAWTCAEDELFSPTWELQKQYLRYHQVMMTYSVTIGTDTATGEIGINVGIAELQNTIYFGGRYANRSATANPVQQYDELHTFSTDDYPNGTGYGSFSETYLGWSGFTFYYDDVAENGTVTRYQYFANEKYISYIVEAPVDSANGVQFDVDGNMTGKILSCTGDVHSNYQYTLLVNETTHDVMIPIAYLNYKGSTVSKDINGSNVARQTSVSIDGWRIGFATDGDGKVIFGFGGVAVEPGLTAAAEVDDEGGYVLPEYVTIPAGGFAWSAFSSQNKNVSVVGEMFCKVDNQLVSQQFTSKYFNASSIYNPYKPAA